MSIATCSTDYKYTYKRGDMVSDFKSQVKHKLIDLNQTQTWLIEQVKEKGECYFDGSYLNKIYSGERNAPKIKNIICEILNIEE